MLASKTEAQIIEAVYAVLATRDSTQNLTVRESHSIAHDVVAKLHEQDEALRKQAETSHLS